MTDPNTTSLKVAAYGSARRDILAFIDDADAVLDLGCNTGNLARSIKAKLPDVAVWGIEYDGEALSQAKDVLDKYAELNLDDLNNLEHFVGNEKFDIIIAGDVLEHLDNPWGVIELLFNYLQPNGRFIISIPNFAFWETFIHLLKQKFPYNPRGIYDDTHKRFFMKNNIKDFIDNPKAEIRILDRNIRLVENSNGGLFLGPFSKLIKLIPYVREFFVFQYIISIRKTG